MPQTSPAPADPRRSPRWLCSHLVRIAQRDSTADLLPGILEDITERGAGVGLEDFLPRGTRIELIADGFRVHAIIAECTQRESDWRAAVAFEPGYGWHPKLWEPDHLYLVPAEQKGSKVNRATAGPGTR